MVREDVANPGVSKPGIISHSLVPVPVPPDYPTKSSHDPKPREGKHEFRCVNDVGM